MKTSTTLLIMGLTAPWSRLAQNSWSFIDTGGSPRTVKDMAFISDGSCIAIYYTLADSTQTMHLGAYRFDDAGALLRDTLFIIGNYAMGPEAIPMQPQDHFRVVGFGRDITQQSNGTAFQFTAWLGPDLVIDSLKMIHLGYDYCVGQFVGVLGPDRQVQPLRCRIDGQSTSPNHHVLLETNMNGDLTSMATYTFAPNSTSFLFDVTGLDAGGFIVSAWGTPWPAGASVMGKAIHFDDQLQFVQARPMDHATSPTNMHTMPHANVDLLKLSQGTILVGGRYRNDQGGSLRSVMQKVDEDLNLLQQFAPVSPHDFDHVALHQCIDTTPNGHILFGHMERFDVLTPEALIPWPNEVRIFKLDTNLNVLCEYEVNGFADSTYYTLARMKATPDGGAVALGSALDLTTPGAKPKAWVRRFAAADRGFTSMPPQHEHGQLQVHPNPGSEGFHLVLPAGMLRPRLHVFDPSWRLVHQATYQAADRVATDHWPAGIYAVVLQDERMGSWSGRWMKE